ncbi:MAG: hypothetical protein D6B28_03810 [Gammaproteobacteria bacterium]|nr:MAG: hypothetical protein D6B28_03810 [Gammaproteobacteria bacterium]
MKTRITFQHSDRLISAQIKPCFIKLYYKLMINAMQTASIQIIQDAVTAQLKKLTGWLHNV